MGNRGQMTIEIAQKAQEMLGKDITVKELRLMPYVQYLIVNGENIDPRKINQEEREILSDWRKRGWIEGGASDLAVSKDFWDALHELLWLGYVTFDQCTVAT